MNGAAQPPRQLRILEIFSDALCEYAQTTVFPWGLDQPLSGPAVGKVLFNHHQPTSDWNVPDVREALLKLSEIGVDKIQANIDEFRRYVLGDDGADDSTLSAPDRTLGVILTLDEGARAVCTGVNARYAYEYFLRIPRHIVKSIASRGMAKLTEWEAAGVDKNQAIIRAVIMLATLVHSEDPEDHELHLRLVEALRKEYEQLTHTRDPHRQTFTKDCEDIHLYGRMLDDGPPPSKNVHMSDIVFGMMRYFTSHIAYLRYFGRSPFQNIARGRDDTQEEIEWLKGIGVTRSDKDNEARKAIRQDKDNGRWRPLQL